MEQKTNMMNQEEDVIDLLELFYVLMTKLHLIILSGLVCALIGLLCTMYLIPAKYTSTTSVYIYNQKKDSLMSLGDLQMSSSLTKDYEVMIKGRNILESTIEQLNLDMTYKQMRDIVSVKVPSDTRIVEISVTTEDPYLSRDIADKIREISSKNISEITETDAVNLVEKADIPERKSSPSISKNTVMGGMVGVVLSCGVIVLLHLLNDTIKNQDDVEKYLGLSVLGTIPLDETMVSEGKKRQKAKKTSGRQQLPKRRKIS